MTVAIHDATPATQAFLASVLRGGESLAPEYPLVFGTEAPGRLVTVEQDGRPVAGCACLTRTLQVGRYRLPVGLIGSVATDADHRRQGHASAVLARAEQALAEAGCAFALLWADEAGWYERRGWVPIGSEADVVLPLEAAPFLPLPDGVRPARPDDADALHALYAAHATRVERTARETAALLAVPGMETLVLEREGTPCAYACRGRGADLQGVVHEWGGAVVDVLALVRAHLERSMHTLVLFAPRDAAHLFRYLRVLGVDPHLGTLGMGKLLDPAAMAEILVTACPAARVETTDEGVRLSGPAGEAVLDATQTLLLLAAPRGLRTVVEATEGLTGLELPALPLAPFCWGLDSI